MEQRYLTTNITELQPYATFEQQADMDETIYEYIEQLRGDEVPESVIEVLRFFGRSSLRVLGVSFAKYETIAESIGYSKRTVIRAINTLAGYGMIERIPTLKQWTGRGRKKSVNIVRIVPAANPSVAPQHDTAGAPDEATADNESNVNMQSEPLVNKHCTSYVTRDCNRLLETIKSLDSAGLKNSIPTPIYDVLAPFYNAQDIRRLTGIIFRAKASVSKSIRLEEHTEQFKTVVLDCIRRLKAGQLRSLDGYLYTSLKRLFRRLQIESAWASF